MCELLGSLKNSVLAGGGCGWLVGTGLKGSFMAWPVESFVVATSVEALAQSRPVGPVGA